ncbi:MAG: endopeptidase La [Bryobacterales bacterium]|nr:endopeptidase La [Bryobacterales bacterium]
MATSGPGRMSIRVPMMPIRDVVIFPNMMSPFVVGRPASVAALEAALEHDKKIFLATQHDASKDAPTPDDVYQVGTIVSIVQSLKLPNGNIKVLVEGLERARLRSVRVEGGYMRALVEIVRFADTDEPELDSLVSRVSSVFEQYVKQSQSVNYETIIAAVRGDDPAKLSDTIGANLPLTIPEKQDLLEIFHPVQRLARIADLLDIELEKLAVDRTIQSRVKKQMEKAQKEYYLNEKIKAIQKELGRGEKSEFDEYRRRIEKAGMSKDAKKKALAEVRKLENMPSMSAESTVSHNYLDWLLSVPWKAKSREIRDLANAEKVLNADHYGLEKVKERILEFLAVRRLVTKPQGSILCFVGPPGVGKTSLGQSIARATGRKFVRLSLGGVRDEAEIRGHRRTYIGALPGQIIQMMKKAGKRNPVFVLDEVDKMSTDFRGDPSAALMEVLDPEQNSAFQDHYLDVEFDLSQVFFIATANVLHTLPAPLLDRMEVIRISGYTEGEKTEIAKRHLVAKQVANVGLKPGKHIEFTDDGIHTIIEEYTREAGVRNLEREISNICRKVALEVVRGTRSKRQAAAVIDKQAVKKYLKVPRYRQPGAELRSEIGTAVGLAWTELGGTLLHIEATLMDGSGKLTLTGKLGDVMQESARAAMSYVRSRSSAFGLPKGFYQNLDVHVHVPEGAIPKDGPSAGITLTTALASALTKVKVRGDVAMTGEVTLRGKVLPIGGLKEKLLAANRYGIREVVMPKENKKDLPDVPENVREGLKLHFVETMDSVLDLALAEPLSGLSAHPFTAGGVSVVHQEDLPTA